VRVDDDAKIRAILKKARSIAVVGASPKPWRDSGAIVSFLREQGYSVIPINPAYTEIDGLRCFPSLRDLPVPIDIVDVFRRPDMLLPIVDDTIAIKAHVLWCQLGVINEAAVGRAVQAGLDVVVNRCIAVEYRRLMH
jgi:predicted CoA-binding protein